MYKLPLAVRGIVLSFAAIAFIYTASICVTGCAQIISPTGGAKDTIPPKIISSTPPNGSLNFRGNKINITFDEYVVIEQLQENLLVSPTPNINPYIDYKLKTITIKLKDSLQENTTYVINLGNAIRDLNEGNPFKDYRFVFSTGPIIDSLTLSGKIILAETGGTDSTMFALLYRNLHDSAVKKLKPAFISKVDKEGKFRFENLPSGTFRLFALKDRDNGRTYNNLTEVFGFLDSPVVVGLTTVTPTLYAYAERKEAAAASNATSKDKNLKYTLKPVTRQELTEPFQVSFNRPVGNLDTSGILLTDTFNVPVNMTVSLDTTGKIFSIMSSWKENETYKLIIQKTFATDSAGNTLAKTDTIKFTTKRAEDYGSVNLRFTNLPTAATLVLQFVLQNEVVFSAPLTGNTWTSQRFKPGEYKLRILIDENKNGIWDTGSYEKKLQPEHVIALPQSINVKANWENEIDIKL